MCTPVGHTLMGLMIASVRRKGLPPGVWFLLTLVIMAVLPDLDLVFGFIAGNVNLYHHLWTHSLVFGTAAGILFGIGVHLFTHGGGLRTGLLGVSAVLSHILLDMLTEDSAQPFGLQALWPFSRKFFIFPMPLFKEVVRDPESRSFLGSLLCLTNARAVAVELLYLGIPAAFLFARFRKGFREPS